MLTKIHNFIRASDLRKNLGHYLKQAKNEPIVVAAERGGETRVILDSALYNKLIEAYEDWADARELAQLVEEDSGEYVALENLKR